MTNCGVCEDLAKKINWRNDTLIHIKKMINQSKQDGDLEELGEVSPSSPFLSVRYRCNSCGAVWKLTYPDQGFKGGFEREEGGDISDGK